MSTRLRRRIAWIGLTLLWLEPACTLDTRELTALESGRAGSDPFQTGGIVVTPGQLDLGVVGPDCRIDGPGLIANTSEKTARIESVRIVNNQAETFSLRALQLPQDLGPGQSIEWGVVARPREAGVFTSAILFEVRDGDGRLIRIERRATIRVDDTPLRTETFIQNTRRAADILFVIDDSASMAPEQDALGRNFRTFLEQADGGLADYHIGVTTTDMSGPGERGRLVPTLGANDPAEGRTQHIVTRGSLPNPAEVFRQNALVGIRGARTERGLDAAQAALSMPLIEADNLGFLRDEASLALVFVSDEDDGSANDVEVFADFFLGLKGDDARRVTASAIVGPEPNGCEGETGRANAGTRYIELARILRGAVESICTADWGVALARISGIAFGLEGRFLLEGYPAGDITVLVEGRERPQVNAVGQTVWVYDPVSRQLTFQQGFAPPEGARVDVRYEPGCPTSDGLD